MKEKIGTDTYFFIQTPYRKNRCLSLFCYRKALLFLDKFINYEKVYRYNYRRAYKLDRVKKLLRLLGDPHQAYKCILIAGTKGKGSTAASLASILSKSGLKTALYTSPHLVSVRERIQIGGVAISKRDFSFFIGLIKVKIEKYGLEKLTFFEILTALAFLYFKNKGVDIAVLEVGLGGRLDATNVVEPIISLITPISYDHTQILGKSLTKIAKEKCGIIKKGCPLVCAHQPKEAEGVIKKTARQKNAKILFVGKDIKCRNIRTSLSGTIFDVRTPSHNYKKLYTPLIGTHQAQNSTAALTAVEILNSSFGFNIREKDIREGLKAVLLPGRFQLIPAKPLIILDGAHNKISIEALKVTFRKLFGSAKPILIFGISSDKDIKGIGRIILPAAKTIIFTKSDSSRAAAPSELADRLGRFCRDYYVTADAKDSLVFAKKLASKKDIILATGSLFVVADILKIKPRRALI